MFPNPMWPYLRLFDDDQRILGLDEAIATALSGDTYADKVKAIFGSSLIDYRRLNEGSGVSAFDSSPKAHAAGTISGATWTPGAGFDGKPALLFDGVNDYVDIYSAEQNTDFNGQLFTLSFFFQVANVGVWTDGANHRLATVFVDASNSFNAQKITTNGRIDVNYSAGGVAKARSITGLSATTWQHMAITCNKVADQLIVYLNGVQQGAIINGLGAWTGALASTGAVIGAQNTAGAISWSGYIRDFALGNAALSASQIAQLAVA